jgi:Nucleotide modification associated domain 2
MRSIYFYKLTCDDGGAPCVQHGLLSLAICKPFIRMGAKPGDLIFGFAANSLSCDNRLIYIAKVTDKRTGGEYYELPAFENRDDCIYERVNGRFRWRSGAKYHGQDHLSHDLGEEGSYERADVLLSNDFRYLGYRSTADYKHQFPAIKRAVEDLGRGHRRHHDEDLRSELEKLADETWKRCEETGRPTQAPSRAACHRSRSCGVIGSDPSAAR